MAGRIEKIKSALPKKAAALITNEADCFYLSGFNKSEGMVLITENSAALYVDFRYIEAAKAACGDNMEVLLTYSFLKDIGERLKTEGVSTVFVQSEHVTLALKKSMEDRFEGINVSCELDIDKLVGDMRAVKNEYEISLIKSAQGITDRAFTYIKERISAGRTEREVALDLEFFMRKEGSEGTAFDTICVSGRNSSKPHGIPGDKVIEKGDFVTLDFGAAVGGYRSDMTRTVAVGSVTDKMRKVYNTVLEAQEAALAAIKPGMVCKDADKIARDIIDNAGFKGAFGHSLGHSVGIDIHEDPSFSARCETLTKPGMVITVEPGIYLQNEFGVRIEDMIIVTENGCEDITKSDKELIVL
ncbi:MAG: aminopeptidase P family protein [Clostridia bacterium]|nr:aminopeptidase P family protein [Clostridia bacterium]